MPPAPWQRIGTSLKTHPLTVDVTLAVGLTAVSVFQGLDDVSGKWRPFDATAVALTALSTLPLAVRRRAPILVFVLTGTFWVAQIALGYNPIVTNYGALLALFTVAATQRWPRIVACMAVAFTIWIFAGTSMKDTSVLTVVLQGLVIPGVIWKVADGAKQLDRSNRRLAEANEQLRRDRAEQARRAVTDERVRIARELHDVVAHHVSVISVQAGLARYVLRSDPDTARVAMDTVLATSGEALDEMRRLLSLLRVGADGMNGEPDADYDPAPGLAGLPELFGRVRAAGVPVEVEVTGAAQPLSPGVELCAYRVIQESLTNVLKHAAPATARVRLDYRPHELVAEIRDDGARPVTPGGDEATGHGLIGMRERAMLYGGTLHAAPAADRGFEVRLALPLTRESPSREEGTG